MHVLLIYWNVNPTIPFLVVHHPSEKVLNLNEIINDPAEINLAPFEIKLLPTEIQFDETSSSYVNIIWS